MDKKIVYIAHPISGDIKGNLEKIRKIIRDINIKHDDILPFAHYWVDCHALDDTNAEERQRGIDNDIVLFKRRFIDELWLYGDKISSGMKSEIELARELNIKIVPMTEETKKEFTSLKELNYKQLCTLIKNMSI